MLYGSGDRPVVIINVSMQRERGQWLRVEKAG